MVQCTINNTSVDITCNQVAALTALLLIEEVDKKVINIRLNPNRPHIIYILFVILKVGKNHLFKRSILLIKGLNFFTLK